MLTRTVQKALPVWDTGRLGMSHSATIPVVIASSCCEMSNKGIDEKELALQIREATCRAKERELEEKEAAIQCRMELGESHDDIMRTLLSHDVIPGRCRHRILKWGAGFGHKSVVKFMIQESDGDVPTALQLAAMWGHFDVVQLLVENGANVGMKIWKQQAPLHVAAGSGHLNVVRFLIQEGNADVGIKNDVEQTPLHLAAAAGQLPIVQFLVQDAQADAGVKDCKKRTPLHLAAWAGHLAVVQFLIQEAHANVGDTDCHCSTSLHLASDGGHLTVVQFLVREAQADVGAKDIINQTSLHNAAASGHLSVVQFLVNGAQANVDAKDWQGHTALYLATERSRMSVVLFLTQNARPRGGGVTALHIAAADGNLALVDYLVREAPINVQAKDAEGRTALDVTRCTDVKEYLCEFF